MLLPEASAAGGPATGCKLVCRLLLQELRGLLAAPALWLMLLALSLLVGYSFITAVELFARASRTALAHPQLAAGLDPMTGIFVPTFGAYYLSETLLLPFVAIRLLALDKQSGALKLLLQLPLSPTVLVGVKLLAMALVWLLSLVPGLLALVCWRAFGGHLPGAEIALLFFGHALYSLLVIAVAMFAAGLSESLSTAAMLALAFTLGTWVLDFAAAGSGGLAFVGRYSPAALLRQFESGLFATLPVALLLGLALFFLGLAAAWLHPGYRRRQRLTGSLLALVPVLLLPIGALLSPHYRDLTESRRHSFAPAVARALAGLDKTLKITVHLDPGDSRRQDLEREVLAKLERLVPHLRLRYESGSAASSGPFAITGDDKYGLIEYEYAGRRDRSYSNSPEEILPLIFALAGLWVRPDPVEPYPGYPLVADARPCGWCFYLGLPLLFLALRCGGTRLFG